MNKSSTFSHLSYSTTTSTTWLGISSKSLSSAWLIVVEIQESVVSGCCKYTNVIQFLSVRERRFVVGACWSILLPQLVTLLATATSTATTTTYLLLYDKMETYLFSSCLSKVAAFLFQLLVVSAVLSLV